MSPNAPNRRVNSPVARKAHWPLAALALLLFAGCDAPQAGPPKDASPDASTMMSPRDCAEPNTMCGGQCVNPMSSATHCGGCGQACGGGSYCVGGTCMRTCPSGYTSCEGDCVDLGSNSENCGACGESCEMDRACRGGTCGCPEGTTECDGECVDPRSDSDNCGLCGRTCDADTQCYRGVCQRTADGRESDCTNGEDDDEDGDLDCEDEDCNGATRTCSAVCGEGAETCEDGRWSVCQGGDGGAEICGDGIDQDCDGYDLTRPDPFEPNNSCMECKAISGDTDPNVRVDLSFDSVGDEVDCFYFVASDDWAGLSTERILIDVTAIPAGHDYDVWLYESQADCAANNWIGRSENGGNDDEHIEWSEGSFGDSGTYYVLVKRFGATSCDSGYRLRINGLNPEG